MKLSREVAVSMQRAAALQAQRRAAGLILSQPRRWPACVWHWAYAALKLSEPKPYRLLYRVTDRAA